MISAVARVLLVSVSTMTTMMMMMEATRLYGGDGTGLVELTCVFTSGAAGALPGHWPKNARKLSRERFTGSKQIAN